MIRRGPLFCALFGEKENLWGGEGRGGLIKQAPFFAKGMRARRRNKSGRRMVRNKEMLVNSGGSLNVEGSLGFLGGGGRGMRQKICT